MEQDTPTGNTMGTGSSGSMGNVSTFTGGGTNTGGEGSTATDSAICPHCGQSTAGGGGIEQFLSRLGISSEMMQKLQTSFQNVEVDEYLNTAREYLKDTGSKAGNYAKENPGKVAAGVAVLAVGAGLLFSSLGRDKEE